MTLKISQWYHCHLGDYRDPMKGLNRSRIVKFFQIDAVLRCEDPFTAIEVQLEYNWVTF